MTPDDLLAGALLAVSRFGIAWIGETAIDVEALGFQDALMTSQIEPKVAYSTATAAIFDRAAAIAKEDGASKVEGVHLLAAFAPVADGLMGDLKGKHGFDGTTWRAALARWPREGEEASGAGKTGPEGPVSKEFFTPEEAADFLGLHIQTVRGYVRSGRLPALRVAGERAIRIRRGDLFGLLEPTELPSGDSAMKKTEEEP